MGSPSSLCQDFYALASLRRRIGRGICLQKTGELAQSWCTWGCVDKEMIDDDSKSIVHWLNLLQSNCTPFITKSVVLL
jgi:hypothetical protein